MLSSFEFEFYFNGTTTIKYIFGITVHSLRDFAMQKLRSIACVTSLYYYDPDKPTAISNIH